MAAVVPGAMTTTTPPPLAPAAPGTPQFYDAGLHRKPALGLFMVLLCFAGAVAVLVLGARAFTPLRHFVLSAALYPRQLFTFAAVVLIGVVVAMPLEHRRRRRLPRLPTYLLLNRALAYGVLVTCALHAIVVASPTGGGEHLALLLSAGPMQALTALFVVVLSACAYLCWLRPLVDERGTVLEPYPEAVARMAQSYDFILGVERNDDWKAARVGAPSYMVMKEHSLWTNLFVFGGIDSGKTSSVAYPFLLQAMRKFADDETLRPSIVLLDLKGDNALQLHEFAKKLGRQHELYVISPGNALLDADGSAILDDQGEPIIPRDRFLTWNPIGGTQPADLRASLLLDGLSATNDGPKLSGSAEYFENVEAEFLSAAVQLFDLVHGTGNVTLLDIYLFAYDEQRRKTLVEAECVKGTTPHTYFKKRFLTMKPEDQGHLISGLTAKLSKLTSPSVKDTFCVRPGDAPSGDVPEGKKNTTRAFTSFLDLVVNKPGIVVFSVPEAIYSRELCRVLGIMFMRSFHNEMLRRSTSQFRAAGGNHKRLILNVVDECWAFMNKGVASFTAVSRQARTCSLFLTQSLDQIPEAYRATVEGNFRTKALLSVNDSLTLKRFEELLGTHKEYTTQVSVSASLGKVRHGLFLPRAVGGDQSLSQSANTNEQIRPRFSQHEIQHLPRNRAVVHLYTEQGQREAVAVFVTPWFELPYFLLPGDGHADIACSKRRGRPHRFVEEIGGDVMCRRCGHRIAPERVALVRESMARVRATRSHA